MIIEIACSSLTVHTHHVEWSIGASLTSCAVIALDGSGEMCGVGTSRASLIHCGRRGQIERGVQAHGSS